MISIVKKKNKISIDLLSKIEWACRLNSIKFENQMILEGCLRVIEHTNLAYVEPHRVIIRIIYIYSLMNMITFMWEI